MATIRVPDEVPSPAQDSETLNKAFRGWGTDEKAIIRVLGKRNESQRKRIRESYREIYGKDLLDDLSSELSGDFKKAVILWTKDPAERDARLANKVLNDKKKTIEKLKIIVEISCTASPKHLIAVRKAYCSLYDSSLEEHIASSVPDVDGCPGDADLRNLLQMVILCLEFPEKHFAKVVHDSIEGFGTDEDSLTRAIVTRAEIDLMKVRGAYFNMYNASMDNAIIGDVSGDYKDFLMTLLGSKI
ncbi:hypothetical protein Bca4012_017939 [Brassica carinata]